VLRQVLARWSSIAPEDLPLEESRRGPVWRGRLAGHNLDISLSYCHHEAWIGLLRGGSIGVDVMRAEPFAEALAVARNYLDPETVQSIQESPDPATAFATAWTKLEAQLKCLKLGLIENPTRQVLAFPPCALENITFASGVVVSVATCAPFALTETPVVWFKKMRDSS
jgi:phosphopantetheinyl transferase